LQFVAGCCSGMLFVISEAPLLLRTLITTPTNEWKWYVFFTLPQQSFRNCGVKRQEPHVLP
jgi:hypothetical protein